MVNLPQDLQKTPTLLILGFTQKSATQASGWSKNLKGVKDCEGSPVEWLQIPVLADVPSLIRPLVVRSIRSSLPPELRPRFVPVFEDEKKWKEHVSYSNQDDAYVLAVNQIGRILGKWHGPFQDSQAQLPRDLAAICSSKLN